MKIACLGWGSLVWRPDGLKIIKKWFEDGPLLPIEFTRLSDNDRITLIIDKEAKPVRTLWALMTCDNLIYAKNSLQEKENTTKGNIHYAKVTDTTNDEIKIILINWLKNKDLDAAIWTGITYSKKTDEKRPTIDYIIDHLKKLDYETRKVAEEYIRKAPRQIDTEYRRMIEMEFG